MSTIKEKAEGILQEKEEKIIPENFIDTATIFNVTGNISKMSYDLSTDKCVTDDVEEVFVASSILNSNTKQYVEANSTISMQTSYNTLSNAIGLTPDKIKKGEIILGVSGNASEVNIVSSLYQPYPAKGIWIESEEQYTLAKYKGNQGAFTWDTLNFEIYTPMDYDTGAVGVVGNSAYLFGVETNNFMSAWAIYEYNFITKQITHKLDVSGRLSHPGIEVVGDKIYVFGSSMANNSTRMYEYDTTNNSIIQKSNIPYDFYSGASAYYDGYIYLIGTQGENRGNRNTFYRYSITNDTYESVTTLPIDMYNCAAACIDGIIYMFAGKGANGQVYSYNINTGELNTLQSSSSFKAIYTNAIVINNEIYFARLDTTSSNAYVFKYSPATNTFTSLNKITTVITSYDSMAVAYNDEIYIFAVKKSGDNFGKYVIRGYYSLPKYGVYNIVLDTSDNIYSTELINNVETNFKTAFVTDSQGDKDTSVNIYYAKNNQFYLL